MESPREGAARFHFSTDAFPERERVTAWREVFGRAVVNIDIEPLNRDGFQSTATVLRLPGLGVMFGTTAGYRGILTKELIKADDISFMAAPTCRWTASQLGRNPVLAPGDGLLMSNTDIGSLTLGSAARFTTFCLPRAALASLLLDPNAAIARVVPSTNIALQLLVGYLSSVLDAEALVTPELSQLAVTHIYDLLAVALGGTRDAMEAANSRGVRAARLHAIKRDILANLAGRDLSLDALAKRHHISPVYIRKLFETENSSFSRFVLEQRLARAHRTLSKPRLADGAIGKVALEAGFGDLSYFNRAFRRRYGATPSEVREQAERNADETEQA
jgi:AraC-like DNA-binding protein